MVCTYCAAPTRVVNSRHQTKQNAVWRRRKCQACGSIVTTQEIVRYDSAHLVRSGSDLEPFSRDTLLISIYKSLAHRKAADSDAAALCDSVIASLRKEAGGETIIERSTLITHTRSCLERFDALAGAHYAAYHAEK